MRRLSLVITLGVFFLPGAAVWAAPAVSGVSGTAKAAAPAPDPRPQVLLAISPVAFHDGEWKDVRKVLSQHGARVWTASTHAGEAEGMSGVRMPVKMAFGQVRAERFDMLIVIGGTGAKTYLWFNPELKKLIQKMHRLHRPLGALSIAPGALVNAGVLDGGRAAALPSPEIHKLFALHQVDFTNQEVVTDGDVVTGSNTYAALSFAVTISQMLPRRSHAYLESKRKARRAAGKKKH